MKTTGSNSDVVDTTYADDTLLVSANIPQLQLYLDSVIEGAHAYGLKLNWKKTKHIRIQHDQDVFDSSCKALKTEPQEVYLGSLLSASGYATASVTRRLGEARGAFLKIQQIWKHANITRKRKVEIYMACVISKLLYSLECECMRAADRARIHAFHCR